MLRNSGPKQPNNVLSHWYAVADGIQFSAQDFYEQVEAELAARKMPRLRSSRIEYLEGGVLSDKRIYLRLARERYAFDVCAAPFGEDYFFSLRFVEVPRGGWIKLIAILFVVSLIWSGVDRLLTKLGGNFWWVVIAIAAAVALWGIVKFGRDETAKPRAPGVFADEMPDFDAFFLNLPVIGDWYERVRKDTYYRHDTRLLYHTIVSEVVKGRAEEFTAAKGVKLLRVFDYNPILDGFYKPSTLKREEPEASS